MTSFEPTGIAYGGAQPFSESPASKAKPLDRSPLGRNGFAPLRPDHASVPSISPYLAQSPGDRAEKYAKARIRGLPTSVKKMNVVAKLVRRLHLDDALIQLALINEKKPARLLLKTLLTARAAAGRLERERLVVDEVAVLRGAYKRRPVIFRGRGGVGHRLRPCCHVFVRLREVPGAEMKTIILKPWWERRFKHRSRCSFPPLPVQQARIERAQAPLQ